MMDQLELAPGLERFDSRLDRLEGSLQANLGGRITNLQLKLEEAGVILHGRARTFYAKQLAQQAFMRLSDLPILANEIEVV